MPEKIPSDNFQSPVPHIPMRNLPESRDMFLRKNENSYSLLAAERADSELLREGSAVHDAVSAIVRSIRSISKI